MNTIISFSLEIEAFLPSTGMWTYANKTMHDSVLHLYQGGKNAVTKMLGVNNNHFPQEINQSVIDHIAFSLQNFTVKDPDVLLQRGTFIRWHPYLVSPAEDSALPLTFPMKEQFKNALKKMRLELVILQRPCQRQYKPEKPGNSQIWKELLDNTQLSFQRAALNNTAACGMDNIKITSCGVQYF